MGKNISVSTDFQSGGGHVVVHAAEPSTIRFSPHDEGDGEWSKVWWYFLVEGVTPGEEIKLELDKGGGVSPQVFFSYDQQVWGLTDEGESETIGGKEFFAYWHSTKSTRVWFAYDLPYNAGHAEDLLTPLIRQDEFAEVFTLCNSRKNRKNIGYRLNPGKGNAQPKYGIWLQARAHAFESGASWVLHELTKWLVSGEDEAVALRNIALITVIPIVDIDGVSEGRTGKYQKPHDHWMKWGDEPAYWPEVESIKSGISALAQKDMADLFIDFHGPGGKHHPYFILPFADELLFDKQRSNRIKFFESLKAKPVSEQSRQTQSMTHIHYSERPWDNTTLDSSHEWVSARANEHSLAFTIEVNMNTPLSNQEGYRSEAIMLGKAISDYFVNGHHEK
ncbi:MAG: M14 family zinc carboxypeptidase [Cyclobacteriaceae bacterium]